MSRWPRGRRVPSDRDQALRPVRADETAVGLLTAGSGGVPEQGRAPLLVQALRRRVLPAATGEARGRSAEVWSEGSWWVGDLLQAGLRVGTRGEGCSRKGRFPHSALPVPGLWSLARDESGKGRRCRQQACMLQKAGEAMGTQVKVGCWVEVGEEDPGEFVALTGTNESGDCRPRRPPRPGCQWVWVEG
jgi:hypothetical protein